MKKAWEKRNDKFTIEKFNEMAKLYHSDDEELDYSKVVINGYMKPITIICHKKGKNGVEHGEFITTPNNFIGKINHCGCPKCFKSEKYEIPVLLERLNKIHRGKFKYNNCVF